MEKEIKLKNNGFSNLFVGLILLLSPLSLIFLSSPFLIPIFILLSVLGFFWLIGLFIITPNQSKVLIFFGKYKGVSLRVRNLETDEIKVNDEQGNPVLISSVVVWKVVDTYKAVFDVEVTKELDVKSGIKRENREGAYQSFVKIQSEAALRSIAHTYPYDDTEEDSEKITLRSGVDEINKKLEQEIRERLAIAGIEVIEARISSLQAIIAARKKIVEGSVGIVKMALKEVESEIEIGADQKASMISNLLVVLSSEQGATPVLKTDL